MSAAQKTAILAQVGHFYFGAVGQYYVGANTIAVDLFPGTGLTISSSFGPGSDSTAPTDCRRHHRRPSHSDTAPQGLARYR